MAFECAKGASMGFASVPYPPETARFVDHASNPAAPDEAAISAYHVLFFRSETSSRLKAGLPGRRDRGALPGSMGAAPEPGVKLAVFAGVATSASVLILGFGTDGSNFEEEDSFATSTETLAERSVTAFTVSPLCGKG